MLLKNYLSHSWCHWTNFRHICLYYYKKWLLYCLILLPLPDLSLFNHLPTYTSPLSYLNSPWQAKLHTDNSLLLHWFRESSASATDVTDCCKNTSVVVTQQVKVAQIWFSHQIWFFVWLFRLSFKCDLYHQSEQISS